MDKKCDFIHTGKTVHLPETWFVCKLLSEMFVLALEFGLCVCVFDCIGISV